MPEEGTRPDESLPKTAVEAVSHDQDVSAKLDGLSKVNSRQKYLQPRARSHSADTFSLLSADGLPELSLSRNTSRTETQVQGLELVDDRSESWIGRWRRGTRRSWIRNKGIVLVLISQFFGVFMSITTRLLETGTDVEPGMNPLQILFARMSITLVAALTFMWYAKVEHFPFGVPEVRILLIGRGIGGFFGVFGLYWSLQYLPLADATVLSFLGPPLACYVCSKILKEPFTKTEQVAAFISLGGVVLIARPATLFSAGDGHSASSNTASANDTNVRRSAASVPEATSHQRLAAVGMAMVGVVGAAAAYTFIRWIGKRAHPLISVSYFALWCTIVSSVALVFIPSVPFVLPHTLRQWSLLFFIGVSGFVMQFLLTTGLQYEKSSRANNMVYVQMLFALIADLVVFGQAPSLLSIAGSTLILGGAVAVAIQKSEVVGSAKDERPQGEESERLMEEGLAHEEAEAGDLVVSDGEQERGRQMER